MVHNVFYLVTALDDVNGLVHADQHLTDRVRVGQPLRELVADVTGLQVAKHKDVRWGS